MRIQPTLERTEFFLQFLNPLGVLNRRVHFQAVADDSRVRKEASAILLAKFCHFRNVESAIGFTEVICPLQNQNPRQPRLIDLENQSFEEQVVVIERESVLGIVVNPVIRIFGMGITVVAISGHSCILPSIAGMMVALNDGTGLQYLVSTSSTRRLTDHPSTSSGQALARRSQSQTAVEL